MSSESQPDRPSETHDLNIPNVQEILDSYLDSHGGVLDDGAVEELCKLHPSLADELRGAADRWHSFEVFGKELRGELGILSQTAESSSSSAEVDAHLQEWKRRRDDQSRYRRLGQVGHGGMGVVYRVYDAELGRELAMKVLRRPQDHGSQEHQPQRLARFLAEAQITSQLDHPGIVAIHEFGLDEEDALYFTMSLVRGRDFHQVLKLVRRGEERWSRTRAVNVLLKVCETLAYAHSKMVIHRDVKPQNVMVGRFGEVYVMDWGLARAGVPDGDTESRVIETIRQQPDQSQAEDTWATMDGAILGTPCYMAPEQAFGRRDEIGPAADVYSVGAILYELLAGRAPYAAAGKTGGAESIVRKLRESPPQPVRELGKDAPAELVAICEKAMRRDRDERYTDTQEMAADLRAFLEGRVVSAYEVGAVAEARKWILRNRRVAALLMVAALVVLGAMAAALLVELRARQDADERAAALANSQLETEQARVAARQEADILDTLLQWMEAMFELPAPERARGRVVTARELIDRAADNFDQDVGDNLVIDARLSNLLGDLYSKLDLNEDALVFIDRALVAVRGLEPVDEFREINLGSLRADALNDLGRFEDANEQYDEVELLLETSPEATAEQWVQHLVSLGASQLDQQRAEQAEATFLRALELADEEGVEAGALSTTVSNNLGVLYHRWGRYDEARPLFERALAYWKRVADERHPQAMSAIYNLAAIDLAQSRYPSARELLLKVIDLRRQVLGDNDTSLIMPLINLAVVEGSLNNWEASTEYAQEAYDRAQRDTTPSDPMRREARLSLGRNFTQQARWQDARPLFEQDLAEMEQRFGSNDARLIPGLTELSAIDRGLGNLRSAAERVERALALRRRHDSKQTVGVVDLLHRAAMIYRDLGEPGKAELRWTESYEVALEQFGLDSQWTIRSACYLGQLQLQLDNVADAEILLEDALDSAREILPPQHGIWSLALYSFALYLEKIESLDEARELIEEVFAKAPANQLHSGYRALRDRLNQQ